MKRTLLLWSVLAGACSGPAVTQDSGVTTGSDASTDAGGPADAGSGAHPDGGDAGRADGGPPDASVALPRFTDRCIPLQPVSPPAPLRTRWVDSNTGDDANSGTSATQAWKTLAKANANVAPGDLVWVSGAFDGGYLRPQVSGTAAHPIVFRVPPSASAVISNAQYGVGLWISGLSYLEFDGFELTGNQAPVDFLNCDHVVVRNSYIHDSNGYARLIGANDNVFEDNRWPVCPSWCMFMSNGSSRNLITRNTFGDSASASLYLAGSSTAPSADNEVSFNDLSSSFDGQLYLTGAITGTRVRCNRIHNAGTADGGGTALSILSSGNLVEDNLFYGNTAEAVRFQAFNGTDCNGNLFAHNDVWGNGGPALRLLLSQAGAVMQDNEARDNIFWGNNRSTDFHWTANGVRYKVVFDTYHQGVNGFPDGGLGNNRIHHNLIGGDPSQIDGGWFYFIGYTANQTLSLAQAEARYAELHDNFEADPLFAAPDAGYFQLLPGSPAVDRATTQPGDVFVGSAPDLGRYEFGP